MLVHLVLCRSIFFFFKQKTAYEVRISDWSSDVCSSDLYADWSDAKTLVPQHHATIGDMLSQRGVDWAWYAGGWDVALAGHANDAQFPSRPNFQPHHQPLNYFVQFAPGTAARSEEHTSELQSLMRISYAVFCLKKTITYRHQTV